ncbi:hypothetical protein [Streptomyces sp. PD-S100-1]|uniref:hypothetical protein n=1 Tax=Streptomyces sp. PD-S100-1 TaxID=3394351 RepID=UPI0039BC2E01
MTWCTTRRWGRPDSPLDIALGGLDLPHRLFRLRPLDEDAIRRMACDLLGAEPDEELARLVSSVSGHPRRCAPSSKGSWTSAAWTST